MATNTVGLHRVFRAPAERLYRAFLDADAMVKWLASKQLYKRTPHGRTSWRDIRMSFTNFTTQQSHAFGGEYLERCQTN